MQNNYFSNSSLNAMKGLHPRIICFFCEALKASQYDFGITAGVRTDKFQNKLYQKGRTTPGKIVTNCDGYKYKSKHQIKSDGTGHAGDIKLYVNGKITWESRYFIDFANQPKIRFLMKKYGVEWGGDWKSFKDYPHWELKN